MSKTHTIEKLLRQQAALANFGSFKPARFAGGHGFVDNYSVLVQLVQKTQGAAH